MIKLQELRKRRNLKQSELAELLHVKQNTISNWENGRTEINNTDAIKLADFFGVSVDYLLGREETKNPPNVYDVDGLVSFSEIGTICAGFNGMLNETLTGEIVDIPLSMISGGHKEDYFVLRVKGNSMYPKLIDGDKILCKRMNNMRFHNCVWNLILFENISNRELTTVSISSVLEVHFADFIRICLH